MKTLILYLIVGGFIAMLLLFVFLTVYFIRTAGRTTIRVVIFGKDRKRNVHKFRTIDEKFRVGDDEYQFLENYVFKTRNRDFIYYNQGQSKPIDIRTGESGNITSKEFKTMMETKLIKDLFSTSVDELLSPQMIILYVILIIVAISFIVMLVKGNGSVSIVSDINKDFIKTAVTEALR